MITSGRHFSTWGGMIGSIIGSHGLRNEVVADSEKAEKCPYLAYRLGNRSVLEWVIDKYQVSEDMRSGILSGSNNQHDEEYICVPDRKVITVSMETVRLVNQLAQAVTQDDWMSQTPVQTREKLHQTITISDFRRL